MDTTYPEDKQGREEFLVQAFFQFLDDEDIEYKNLMVKNGRLGFYREDETGPKWYDLPEQFQGMEV